MEKTYVVGHKNPDTDSVTSAIALSYFKNLQGSNTEPRVLGPVNKETQFVLKHFNMKTPKLLNDVKVQIDDIPYNRHCMIFENDSIYDAYSYMINNGLTGLPVVKKDKTFLGYVSLKEIATDQIKGDFDSLKASYKNILRVLEGKGIIKFDNTIEGEIVAATYSSESFIESSDFSKDSIVIVGNRKKVLNYCINERVKLIILVGNHELSDDQLKKATKNKVNVIKTPKNTFEVCKLIGLSNFISMIVRNESPVVFDPKDYFTDFLEVSNKLKHTNYPIVDKNGVCKGMLRLLDINTYKRKKVILVDHNEIKQSVDGLNEAVIEEIVDHHALGNLTTNIPISFRNMSVGSTNTIIYKLFKEANLKIPKDIAGIMLSGILSDTLILKSPTTTDIDREAVEFLAKRANLNYEDYGMKMIKAGSSLDGMSVEDIVFYDYKEFKTNDMGYGIGQILTLDYDRILKEKDKYIEFLDKTCKTKGYKLMALFVTDVVNNGSYLIYSSNAKQIMSLAYGIKDIQEGQYLKGVISRKKQVVPNIMTELENMN